MPSESVAMRGDILNRARVERGLTRAEFYRKVGCDPRTGAKVLAGKKVHLRIARRVAEVLEKNVAEVADVDALVA